MTKKKKKKSFFFKREKIESNYEENKLDSDFDAQWVRLIKLRLIKLPLTQGTS